MATRARAAVAALAMLLIGCGADPELTPRDHAYADDAVRCMSPPAEAVPADGRLETPDRLDVQVRVPSNHRPDIAHPLLVVYAAAGMTPTASERFTHFTAAATAAGYVVAYVRHIRPSPAAVRKLGAVPATVARHYCIDPRRVHATGHSDGGTTTTALAVQPESAGMFSAIAPSAAGFAGRDLADFACPAPRPVLVWHGARDRLFPGWGREAAAWWARCNGCALQPEPWPGGCVRYAGCTRPVHYCEGDSGHATWPSAATTSTLAFFSETMQAP
ncbi:MAG: PHB depolymerase family esterase [Gammaproteobacteria bacterium]